jgi:hypothetical protein
MIYLLLYFLGGILTLISSRKRIKQFNGFSALFFIAGLFIAWLPMMFAMLFIVVLIGIIEGNLFDV